MVLLAACAGAPRIRAGDPWPVTESGAEKPVTGLSPADLYRYYHMGLAAWREPSRRDSPGYLDTAWERRFFGAPETNTLGYTMELDGTLFIAHRGSQAPRNRIDLTLQMDHSLDRFRYGRFNEFSRAHRGFLAKYSSVRNMIHEHLAESECDRIMIVGHSGGGAVAALTFHDLVHEYPDKDIRVVTFGMPRIFNHKAAAELEQHRDRFIRVVNGNDPITMVPSRVLAYRHVGLEMRIGRRRWYAPLSWYDHFPGYEHTLRDLLEQDGLRPDDLGLADHR